MKRRRPKNIRKALQPALDDLQGIKLKRLGGDPLSAEEHAVIDELIDAVINDRDPRDKFWSTARGTIEPMKKLQMALRVASKAQAAPQKTMDELWGEVAIEFRSTYDTVAKAWAAYQKM